MALLQELSVGVVTEVGETIGTTTILARDSNGKITKAKGTTFPTGAGYAVGAEFTNTTTGIKSINKGTTSSASYTTTPTSGFSIQTAGATIATTGATSAIIAVPYAGTLSSIEVSGTDALAANDTNYITFTVTNLTGSVVMLAATNPNTTKATGGAAIAANTSRALTVHGTAANLAVAQGDRLTVTATATGTLANTVTNAIYTLRFA